MRNKRIMFTMVIVMVAIMTIFSFAGCKGKVDTSSDALSADIYNVNGYQLAPADVAAITKDPARPVVPVSEMLEKTGLSLKNPDDAVQIAANIYQMAVRNAARVDRTGYQVATNASVSAVGINAKLGFIPVNLPKIDVGLRSTYSSMDMKGASFSQTVSGVTQLDLDGLGQIGDGIKSNFGYNIQHFSNSEFIAHRNGGNAYATFFNFEDDKLKAEAPKLILGATVKKDPLKAFPNKPTTGKKWDEAKSFLAKLNTPAKNAAAPLAAGNDPTIAEPWLPLTENPSGEPFEVTIPGQDPMIYQLGNMGCGWALYNFTKDNLDSNTTKVEYDKKNKVYTLTMKVKDGMEDDACKFAKSNLIKDTKAYVVLDHPTYTKLENVIQIHECGLIKSWERDELLGAEGKQAYLTVFSGKPASDVATGGGSTGNKSISVFSYDAVDCDPLNMAALYWPQLGDKNLMSKFGTNFPYLNLEGRTTYENYHPLVNGKKLA